MPHWQCFTECILIFFAFGCHLYHNLPLFNCKAVLTGLEKEVFFLFKTFSAFQDKQFMQRKKQPQTTHYCIWKHTLTYSLLWKQGYELCALYDPTTHKLETWLFFYPLLCLVISKSAIIPFCLPQASRVAIEKNEPA